MVKVISLSDEAYRKLKMIKGDGSFSEIVVDVADERLSGKKKKSMKDFFGAFADNAEEWEEIKKKIYEDRKKFKLREVRF